MIFMCKHTDHETVHAYPPIKLISSPDPSNGSYKLAERKKIKLPRPHIALPLTIRVTIHWRAWGRGYIPIKQHFKTHKVSLFLPRRRWRHTCTFDSNSYLPFVKKLLLQAQFMHYAHIRCSRNCMSHP